MYRCIAILGETESDPNQIIPHRLTVASVAKRRCSTSNMMRTLDGKARRSPFGRVRSLLSSSKLRQGASVDVAVLLPRNSPVHVFHPFRVHIAIKDDPVPLGTLAAHIVDNFAQDVGEEPVGPLTSRVVQHTVQGLLAQSLGIDYIGDALDTVNFLHCALQGLPGFGLASSCCTDHYQAVRHLLDLIQLNDLAKPGLVGGEVITPADRQKGIPQGS